MYDFGRDAVLRLRAVVEELVEAEGVSRLEKMSGFVRDDGRVREMVEGRFREDRGEREREEDVDGKVRGRMTIEEVGENERCCRRDRNVYNLFIHYY